MPEIRRLFPHDAKIKVRITKTIAPGQHQEEWAQIVREEDQKLLFSMVMRGLPFETNLMGTIGTEVNRAINGGDPTLSIAVQRFGVNPRTGNKGWQNMMYTHTALPQAGCFRFTLPRTAINWFEEDLRV